MGPKVLNYTIYVNPFWCYERVCVDDLVRVEIGSDGYTTIHFPKCDGKTLETNQSVQVNFGPKYKRSFPHIFATVANLERGKIHETTVEKFLKMNLLVLDQHSNGQPETDPIMSGINEAMDSIFCDEIIWPWKVSLLAGCVESIGTRTLEDAVIAWPECLLEYSCGDGFRCGKFFIGDCVDPNAVVDISAVPGIMQRAKK